MVEQNENIMSKRRLDTRNITNPGGATRWTKKSQNQVEQEQKHFVGDKKIFQIALDFKLTVDQREKSKKKPRPNDTRRREWSKF